MVFYFGGFRVGLTYVTSTLRGRYVLPWSYPCLQLCYAIQLLADQTDWFPVISFYFVVFILRVVASPWQTTVTGLYALCWPAFGMNTTRGGNNPSGMNICMPRIYWCLKWSPVKHWTMTCFELETLIQQVPKKRGVVCEFLFEDGFSFIGVSAG